MESELKKRHPFRFNLGFERGRKIYQNCQQIPMNIDISTEEDVAYWEGILCGYEEEKNSDISTNFIYPEL